MNILMPIEITAAMIGAGTTIAEPAAGETAWVSGAAVAAEALRIRSTTHKVYKAIAAIGAASPESLLLPEDAPTVWQERGPTQRFAPFDLYSTTQATDVTSITFELTPGYFNALGLYGLVGTGIVVSILEFAGGAEIYRYPTTGVASLITPPTGWYDYFFGRRKQMSKLLLTDLPIRPASVLTITVTAATGEPVAIGMINAGDYRPLVGVDARWGGTETGARVSPTTYSFIDLEDGEARIVRRPFATNLNVTVKMDRAGADTALQSVQEVLDIPVSWVASDAPGLQGLNVFGIGSGDLTYNSTDAEFDIQVRGLI